MAKKTWSELTLRQRKAVYAAGAVETVLTVATLVDLRRRPSEDVRGPKAAWVAAAFVQPLGPIAYFLAGRRG